MRYIGRYSGSFWRRVSNVAIASSTRSSVRYSRARAYKANESPFPEATIFSSISRRLFMGLREENLLEGEVIRAYLSGSEAGEMGLDHRRRPGLDAPDDSLAEPLVEHARPDPDSRLRVVPRGVRGIVERVVIDDALAGKRRRAGSSGAESPKPHPGVFTQGPRCAERGSQGAFPLPLHDVGG